MGLKSGDKARYFRKRRKKIAARVKSRALRKELQEVAAKKPEAAAQA